MSKNFYNLKKNKILFNNYKKCLIFILLLLFIFVTIRGFSSFLNQKKIKLEKELHSLGTSIEWIKYEINEKISLYNLENTAKKNGMIEITKENTIVIPAKK